MLKAKNISELDLSIMLTLPAQLEQNWAPDGAVSTPGLQKSLINFLFLLH